jgi:nucleoside-diphosphate-sugar epimerase
MSVLLIGGTGLIGSHLACALRDHGSPVTLASRSPPRASSPLAQMRWVQCDIGSPGEIAAACRAAQATQIVHLAAALQFACEAQPALVVRVNIGGTANALEAARDCGIERVVFASSVAAYGGATDRLHEEMPPSESASLYGQSKWFEERLGIRYAECYGVSFVALRYCGVFGPGSSGSPGMAQIRQRIERSRHGEAVTVPEARGDERLQLTYVADAVSATLLALKAAAPAYSVYNVAGPAENYLSLRQYHAAVKSLFPLAAEVEFSGRARDFPPMDTSRIRQDLGFEPRYTVDEGLREMFFAERRERAR